MAWVKSVSVVVVLVLLAGCTSRVVRSFTGECKWIPNGRVLSTGRPDTDLWCPEDGPTPAERRAQEEAQAQAALRALEAMAERARQKKATEEQKAHYLAMLDAYEHSHRFFKKIERDWTGKVVFTWAVDLNGGGIASEPVRPEWGLPKRSKKSDCVRDQQGRDGYICPHDPGWDEIVQTGKNLETY